MIIKGGTLIGMSIFYFILDSLQKLTLVHYLDYEGSMRLLEIAQVPAEHTEDFKSGMIISIASDDLAEPSLSAPIQDF